MKTMIMETEPRDFITLLGLLKDNIHLLISGLCQLSGSLYEKNKITKGEFNELLSYIDAQSPAYHKTGHYYFPKGDIEIRLEWLNKQIKSLEIKQVIK